MSHYKPSKGNKINPKRKHKNELICASIVPGHGTLLHEWVNKKLCKHVQSLLEFPPLDLKVERGQLTVRVRVVEPETLEKSQ